MPTGNKKAGLPPLQEQKYCSAIRILQQTKKSALTFLQAFQPIPFTPMSWLIYQPDKKLLLIETYLKLPINYLQKAHQLIWSLPPKKQKAP